jgi:hypothetical protein
VAGFLLGALGLMEAGGDGGEENERVLAAALFVGMRGGEIRYSLAVSDKEKYVD